MEKPHITYDELLEIVSWGIFAMNMRGTSVCDNRIEEYKSKNIKNAMYKGIYTGSPARDIYYMLPYLSEEQMREVAISVTEKFPIAPPIRNHVNISAFVRFIYGQFDKQGILRSEKDFERMKKEKLDWSLSRRFLKILYKELENKKNNYGLMMLCEMEAHRLGDEAVINGDKKKLKEMENSYHKSLKLAYKCKSHKHLFSIYYYMWRYFFKFKDIKNALKYSKLTIVNASQYYHKYYPNGDDYWAIRLKNTFKHIKTEVNEKNWKKFKKQYGLSVKMYKTKKKYRKAKS